MMRAYRHSGQYVNEGKIEQIVAVSREYRKYFNFVINKTIANFYRNPKVPKFLPTYSVTKLSERYRQTCGSQVRSTLNSWLGNIANRIEDCIGCSNLSVEVKKKLYAINKQRRWFTKELSVYGKEVTAEELKLCRKIFKAVCGKRPIMKHPSMLLDKKVATLEKAGKANSTFDYWIKLSTLIPRKIIYVPLKTYPYYTEQEGMEQNAIQVIVGRGSVNFGLIKDVPHKTLTEKNGEVGVDLGVLELINSSTGNRYGTTLFPLLKKYDRLIQKQIKGRMRHNLMDNSRWLDELYGKVKNLVKNEVGRALNTFICIERPEVLVVERLKNLVHNTKNEGRLSKSMRRLLIKSGISQLRKRMSEKCAERGIQVVEVNPAYTSQECNSCHYIAKENRKGQTFQCLRCGRKANADYNGSVNVRGRRSIPAITVYTPHHIVKEILATVFSRQDASDREAMFFGGPDPPTFQTAELFT